MKNVLKFYQIILKYYKIKFILQKKNLKIKKLYEKKKEN